jgi:hypothetical protein
MVVVRIHGVATRHGVVMGVPFFGADGLALVVIGAAAAHGSRHRALDRDREGQQPDQQGADNQRHAGSVGAAPVVVRNDGIHRCMRPPRARI